ncbi:hypothetical protein LY76DRAFT_263087 [Colletotrichum caudatum]|nr:hypothetical protein LY76DRAFT_263087 [Colletotrichum caudatum]
MSPLSVPSLRPRLFINRWSERQKMSPVRAHSRAYKNKDKSGQVRGRDTVLFLMHENGTTVSFIPGSIHRVTLAFVTTRLAYSKLRLVVVRRDSCSIQPMHHQNDHRTTPATPCHGTSRHTTTNFQATYPLPQGNKPTDSGSP